jgi:RNA polymerase sigma factor (sigma-70 family)
MMTGDTSDSDLAALGTRAAFEILFHRHRTPVFHFIARQVADRGLAEDLFQTVFLKAFRSLASFRGDAGFRTWLFSIAVNVVNDERRRPRTLVPLTDDVDPVAAPARSAPEADETAGLVRSAIGELPDKHRQLFLLVRFHGMRIAEAAAAVGLTPGSAKVTLFRIQTQIGSRLKSLGALL